MGWKVDLRSVFLTVNFPSAVFECFGQKVGPESPRIYLTMYHDTSVLNDRHVSFYECPPWFDWFQKVFGGACWPLRAKFQVNQTFIKFLVLYFPYSNMTQLRETNFSEYLFSPYLWALSQNIQSWADNSWIEPKSSCVASCDKYGKAFQQQP